MDARLIKKLTFGEVLLIILVILILVIGADHLVLRTKYDFLKWQNEATTVITTHDILLKRITDQMNIPRTPPVPSQGQEKKGP